MNTNENIVLKILKSEKTNSGKTKYLCLLGNKKETWMNSAKLKNISPDLLYKYKNSRKENVKSKKTKENQEKNQEDEEVKTKSLCPDFNLSDELDFMNFNEMLDCEESLTDSEENSAENHEIDKIFLMKSSNKLLFNIEVYDKQGNPEKKRVTYDFLRENYPIEFFDFIQNNVFQKDGIEIKGNRTTKQYLNI
jgi:hypothetical protein